MEQHPVPQNVTTFQFRLIGDMTIKQFGYLAAGAIAAYVCYKLPIPFFFSWPLAFVAGLAGFGFAFVPIEERPMDIWVTAFIKNIYAPTQFVWSTEKPAQKPPAPAPTPRAAPLPPSAPASHAAAAPAPAPSQSKPVSSVLQNIFTPTGGTIVRPASPTPPQAIPSVLTTTSARKGPFDWLLAIFSPPRRNAQGLNAPMAQAPAIPTPAVAGTRFDISIPPKVTPSTPPSPAQTIRREEELASKAQAIKEALEEKTQTHTRILELQKQLTEVLDQRDKMQKELAAFRSRAQQEPPPAPAPQTHAAPAAAALPQVPHAPTVKIITPEGALKAGIPRLTTFPNVVTGITRDSDNNFLPGVLITVRDREGVPLRALKTNRLGQFAASTPIANGTYFVEIEDPRGRYTFDRVQVTLNGSIVPALEIIAKSQKELARDKLAKEIFG